MIAAPSQFEAFIGQRGLRFAHLPGEFLDLMESPEGKAAMSGSGGFAAGFKLDQALQAHRTKRADARVGSGEGVRARADDLPPQGDRRPHVAKKLGCPAVLASPLPGFTPTQEFASPLVPFKSLGPLNGLTHSLMAGSGEAIFRGMVAEWRVSELGLNARPARPFTPAATLYAYSPRVLPVPLDWPATVSVTGYWLLDDDRGWQPDDALSAFLAAGDAPVYVGFRSMPGLDPAAMTKVVLEALTIAGKRGVIATGGGALSARTGSTDQVNVIEGAPDDKLFPLMAACVHHGGAGSTAASLRAGRPTVICPFFGDQPFWGRRVEELGVGAAPIDRKNFLVEKLAAAIARATSDRAMAARAATMGAGISREDGVGRAIDFRSHQAATSAKSASRRSATSCPADEPPDLDQISASTQE